MPASPHFSGTKMARMVSFLRAHKRVITFSLVAFGAFWLAPSWGEEGPFYFLLFFALFVMERFADVQWNHPKNGWSQASVLPIGKGVA